MPKRGLKAELRRARKAMRAEKTTGQLHQWLMGMQARYGKDTEYRVTPNAVYVFKERKMITVILLPQEYRRSATAQWRKHNSKE